MSIDINDSRGLLSDYDTAEELAQEIEDEMGELDSDLCNYHDLYDVLEVRLGDANSDMKTAEQNLKDNHSIDIGNAREWCEAADRSHYADEVFEAAHESDVSVENVEEAYQGEFGSDAEFAQDMADQMGYMDEGKSWPFDCIDWEQAARDLMMDYMECNDHYFRCF